MTQITTYFLLHVITIRVNIDSHSSLGFSRVLSLKTNQNESFSASLVPHRMSGSQESSPLSHENCSQNSRSNISPTLTSIILDFLRRRWKFPGPSSPGGGSLTGETSPRSLWRITSM